MLTKNPTRDQVMAYFNNLDRNKTTIEGSIKDITEWDVSGDKFIIILNGQPYHFRSWAKSQLLKKLKIPVPYFNICSEDLRNRELTEGIANIARGADNKFKVWINPDNGDQTIYGIIPKKCPDLITGEIVEKVLDGMGSETGVEIEEMASDLEFCRLRFFNKSKSLIEVDEEFPGVDFSFSEVLMNPILLQSALLRKVCSNVLVVPQEINQSFKMPVPRFDPDIFNMQIQYVESANSGLDAVVKSLESLKTLELPPALINVEDPKRERNLFDDVFEYVLPPKLRSSHGDIIRAEYNQENNLTVNGVVNAVTKIARDITDESKVSLEQSAGKFVSLVAVHAEQAGSDFTLSQESLGSIFKKKKRLGNAGITQQSPTAG